MSRILAVLFVFLLVFGFVVPVGAFAGDGKGKSSSAIDPGLEVVAELDQRPANIAVAVDGQIIVSLHPFDNPDMKLIQIMKDGTIVPFPTKEWNKPQDQNGVGFVNVIGLHATPDGSLLVLDMGDKDHAPRIVMFNLRSTQTDGERFIARDFTTDQSFLQDFAFDWDKNRIFIADMGQDDLTASAHPALIDVSVPSGWVRRVFSDLPEFMPTEKPIEINGRVLMVRKDGKDVPVRAGLNSITIDPQMDWLYFAPMGEGKLYRIPVSRLSDLTLSQEDILKRLEVVSEQKPESDGITVDSAGNVYVAAIGRNEIGVIVPDGSYKTYIKDDRLDWVDGFSFGPDGYLYATVSQLDRAPLFNKGEDKSIKPYLVVKFKPLAQGAIGR